MLSNELDIFIIFIWFEMHSAHTQNIDVDLCPGARFTKDILSFILKLL